MAFTRELQDRIEYMMSSSQYRYPTKGSSGVYLNELIVKMMDMTGNEMKLFWLLVAAVDEYNQVHKKRREIGEIYMKVYKASNMSKDVKRLIELRMIATVGNVLMVNPYLVLPPTKNPKLKAMTQEAWLELVELGY